MTITAYGLDVKTRGVSVARLTNEGTPTRLFVPGTWPPDYSATSWIKSFDALTEKIVGVIHQSGLPDIVVMNKLTVDHQRSDKTGPARAGLWWSLARAMVAEGWQVADAPPLLAVAKLFTNAPGGLTPSKVCALAAAAVPKLWPRTTNFDDERFQAMAVVYAACGVMTLGGTTAIKLTEARGRVLDQMWLPPSLRPGVASTAGAAQTEEADEEVAACSA